VLSNWSVSINYSKKGVFRIEYLLFKSLRYYKTFKILLHSNKYILKENISTLISIKKIIILIIEVGNSKGNTMHYIILKNTWFKDN